MIDAGVRRPPPERAGPWATLVVAGVLLLGGLCLQTGLRQVGEPFAGFLAGRNRVVLSVIRPGWSLPHTARVLFAEVVAIDGRPVVDAAEIQRHAAALPPGTPVLYRFRKNADVFTEMIAVQVFEWSDAVALYGGAFGAGLCFAGAGLWSLRRRPTPTTVAFFVLCEIVAVVLVTGADSYGPDYRLTPVYLTAFCGIPAALLYFAGSFPEPIGVGSPWRAVALVALAAGAAALAVALNHAADTPAAFEPLTYSLNWLLANALLLYLARLLIGVWSVQDPASRRALRHALTGVVLPAVVSELLFVVAPALTGSVAPIFLVGPLAAFPLFTAAAFGAIPAPAERPAGASVNLRLSLLFLGAVETAFLVGVGMHWLGNSRERLLDDYALNQRRQLRLEHVLEAPPHEAGSRLSALEGLVQTVGERDLVARAAAAFDRDDAVAAHGLLGSLADTYRDEERRLHARRERLNRAASNLILGLIAIGLVQAVAFMLAVNRWLIRPIDQLAAGTDIIATGDLTHRVQLDSGDEFAQLARAINAMATSLAEIRRRADAEQDARHRAAGEATDAERRRVARELHDGVLQDLGAMKLRLESEQKRTAAAHLQPIVDGLIAIIAELRRLVDDLRPPTLSHASLAEAIAAHAGVLTRGRPIAIDLQLADDTPLAEWATRDVYRIAQEAIRNAVHHGAPRHLSVRLAREGTDTVLEVFDDGAGFDEAKAALGGGILGMRERAAALGAQLEITTAPGEGTMIRLVVPTAPQRPWRYTGESPA